MKAQDGIGKSPVRLVFTTQQQDRPFGQDPVWGGWPEGSMARAMSYIDSHRRAVGEGNFGLLAYGKKPAGTYALYPEDFVPRIMDYCGFEGNSFKRDGLMFQISGIDEDGWDKAIGAPKDGVQVLLYRIPDGALDKIASYRDYDLVVVAFGREPEVCRVVNVDGDTVTVVNLGTTGKYIGVADFTLKTDFTVKFVDVSGFPADPVYTEHFQPLADSVRAYFNTPLTEWMQSVRQSDALFGSSDYAALFHRFQLETTGADISLFACPVWGDSISAGGFTPRDIVQRFRYDNRLCIVRLTGEEIVRYLEYVYGLRYNTVRKSTDDLLRMTRDRDGLLQMRTAVYNLDEAGGIRYEVDVSRPEGRRVRILSMTDGTPFEPGNDYRVVMNSHRASGGQLLRGTGRTDSEIPVQWKSSQDYRILLCEWLEEQGEITAENLDNWQVIPESFVDAAKKRFNL